MKSESDLAYLERNCLLDQFLKRNFYKAVWYMIEVKWFKLDEEIIQKILKGFWETNKAIQGVENELKSKKMESGLIVQAAVEWAQNLDYVFVEIRYAHRHDAPGCGKISDEQVTINENNFSISAYCLSEGITSQKI